MSALSSIFDSTVAWALSPSKTISACHLRPPFEEHYYSEISGWRARVVEHEEVPSDIRDAIENIEKKHKHTFVPKELAQSHCRKINEAAVVIAKSKPGPTDEQVVFEKVVRANQGALLGDGRFSVYLEKGSKVEVGGYVYKVHLNSNSERVIPYSGDKVLAVKGREAAALISEFLEQEDHSSFYRFIRTHR